MSERMNLPAERLRGLLVRTAARTASEGGRGGRRELARRYAERFGVPFPTAYRLIERIAAGQSTVSIETADRIAILCEAHVAEVYPNWVGV